jgi:hypothetical protein
MKPTIATALCWTLPWVAALCTLLVLAHLQPFQISHDGHTVIRWLGATAMIGLAFSGLIRASRYVQREEGKGLAPNWYQDGHLVALVIFWAMFPPAWFFTEYFCLDHRFLAPPLGPGGSPIDHAAVLASATAYANLASKIWAGSSAVIGALLAVARK